MKDFIICDIDGTLSDCSKRVHLAKEKRWDEFHAAGRHDPAFEDVLYFLKSLRNLQVVLLTGRTENHIETTTEWLKLHDVNFLMTVMRPVGDHRPDAEFKISALEKIFGDKEAVLDNVLFCLEDRDKMVKAYRDYGLNCWQVRPGEY